MPNDIGIKRKEINLYSRAKAFCEVHENTIVADITGYCV
jgi:hypothetical protein